MSVDEILEKLTLSLMVIMVINGRCITPKTELKANGKVKICGNNKIIMFSAN